MVLLSGKIIEPCKTCWICGGKKNCGKEAESDPAAEFLKDYETEEQELIVLLKEFTKGGAVRGDFLFPAVSFLAYADPGSGRVIRKSDTLCWMIRHSSANYKHNFKDYGIYTVLVRKIKPDILIPSESLIKTGIIS